MPKRSKPHKTISAGAISIPIYKTAKGFTAKWSYGGVAERRDRVNFREICDEVQRIAVAMSQGDPINEEAALRKDLNYYRELEKKMNGVPLHLAVDSYLLAFPSNTLASSTVADVALDYQAAVKKGGASTGWQGTLRSYLRILEPLARREIHTVAADELSALLDHISGSGTYKNNLLTTIKSLFTFARDKKKALPRDRRTEADMIDAVDEKKKKLPLYTPEEMNKLLRVETDNELLKQVQDVICLAGFCGLRMSEAHGENSDHAPLQVEKIFFAHDSILLGEDEQKVGTRGNRYAPLPPNAKKWLAHLKGKHGSIWTGKKFNDRFDQLAKEADVTLRRNMLRKSFITYRMAIIKNANQVSEEAGTSPEQIKKHYQRPELEHVAKAWFQIFPTR